MADAGEGDEVRGEEVGVGREGTHAAQTAAQQQAAARQLAVLAQLVEVLVLPVLVELATLLLHRHVLLARLQTRAARLGEQVVQRQAALAVAHKVEVRAPAVLVVVRAGPLLVAQLAQLVLEEEQRQAREPLQQARRVRIERRHVRRKLQRREARCVLRLALVPVSGRVRSVRSVRSEKHKTIVACVALGRDDVHKGEECVVQLGVGPEQPVELRVRVEEVHHRLGVHGGGGRQCGVRLRVRRRGKSHHHHHVDEVEVGEECLLQRGQHLRVEHRAVRLGEARHEGLRCGGYG